MPPVSENERNSRRRQEPPNNFNAFTVSNGVYTKANLILATATILFIPLAWIFHNQYVIEQEDIQTMAGVVTSVGSFALAIPIFFKDLDQQALFWKQFFFIALTFFLAAFLALFILIGMSADPEPVDLYFYIFVLLVVITNIHALPSWLYLIYKRRPTECIRLSVAVQVPYTFALSLIPLMLCLVFSTGNRWIVAFLLLTFYGFYLTLLVCLALILQLLQPRSETVSIRQQLKEAIETLADEYKQEALSKDKLLFLLRHKKFFRRQEVVNAAIVEELIEEMNQETESGPKISRADYSYDKIIPRWRTEYDQLIQKAYPGIIMVNATYSGDDLLTAIDKKCEDQLLDQLSHHAGLSKELLKDSQTNKMKYSKEEVIEYYTDDLYSRKVVIGFQIDIYEEIMRLKQNLQELSINQIIDIFQKEIWIYNSSEELPKVLSVFLNLPDYIDNCISEQDIIEVIKEHNANTGEEIEDILYQKYFSEVNIDLAAIIWQSLGGVIRKRIRSLSEKKLVRKTHDEDNEEVITLWKNIER